MHPSVLELLGDSFGQGQPNGTGKDRASRVGSNSVQGRTMAESARESKGFEAEHVFFFRCLLAHSTSLRV